VLLVGLKNEKYLVYNTKFIDRIIIGVDCLYSAAGRSVIETFIQLFTSLELMFLSDIASIANVTCLVCLIVCNNLLSPQNVSLQNFDRK